MLRKLFAIFSKEQPKNSVMSPKEIPLPTTLKPLNYIRLNQINFSHAQIPSYLIACLSEDIIDQAYLFDYQFVINKSNMEAWFNQEKRDVANNNYVTTIKPNQDLNPATKGKYVSLTHDELLDRQAIRFVEYQELLFRRNEKLNKLKAGLNSQQDISQGIFDFYIKELELLSINQKIELEIFIKNQLQDIEHDFNITKEKIEKILDDETYLLKDGNIRDASEITNKLKEAALKYYFRKLESYSEEKRNLILGKKYYSDTNEVLRRIILQVENQETNPSDHEIEQLEEMLNEFYILIAQEKNRAMHIAPYPPVEKTVPFLNETGEMTVQEFALYSPKLSYSHTVLFKQQSNFHILQSQPALEIESPFFRLR